MNTRQFQDIRKELVARKNMLYPFAWVMIFCGLGLFCYSVIDYDYNTGPKYPILVLGLSITLIGLLLCCATEPKELPFYTKCVVKFKDVPMVTFILGPFDCESSALQWELNAQRIKESCVEAKDENELLYPNICLAAVDFAFERSQEFGKSLKSLARKPTPQELVDHTIKQEYHKQVAFL